MADKETEYYKNQDDKLTSGQKTKQFIWNPRTKEFLGRTGSSWAKLCIFYLIFYTCLAAFWALMLLIFYQTLDERDPKWQQDESRIGKNPGLGFRPRPPADKVESTLVWFVTGSQSDQKHWIKELTDFIKPYKTVDEKGEFLINECPPGQIPKNNKNYCVFKWEDISKEFSGIVPAPCSDSNAFGYRDGTPCVLIKLNRIFGWIPEPYDKKKLPSDLVKIIGNNTDDLNENQIYFTCEGENEADKESIGQLKFFPKSGNDHAGGIDLKYFPFRNQPGYLSPFVMVQFTNPTPGIVINVECKAWAKNIEHDRVDREGSVHFELLMD